MSKLICASIRFSFARLVLAAFLLFSFSACQHAKTVNDAPLVSNSENGELTELVSKAEVVLIPQWHLSPNEDTKANPRPKLPQGTNQVAIYRQLVEWIDAGQVDHVIVEGCEGEIAEDSDLKFNGWTVKSLKELSQEDLALTLTQVGLKLKAHYGSKLRVECGDDLRLIEKNQLLLSDMRGLLGFKIRITEFKTQPAKRKDYVATVRELLKLRPETDDQRVIQALDRELQGKVDQFEVILKERNEKFASKIRDGLQAGSTGKVSTAERGGKSAVVIGALHVADLGQKIRAGGKSVVTFRPLGLEGGESDLIAQIRQLLTYTSK